jgi:4-oxalocrotonate tautomerase
MPHLIVKMYPGRTEEQKKKLTMALTQAVIDSIGAPDDAISIAIEEIAKEDWEARVTRVDIAPKLATIYKHSIHTRPG